MAPFVPTALSPQPYRQAGVPVGHAAECVSLVFALWLASGTVGYALEKAPNALAGDAQLALPVSSYD